MSIYNFDLEQIVRVNESGIELRRVEDSLLSRKVCIRYGLAKLSYSLSRVKFTFYSTFVGCEIFLYLYPDKSEKYKEFNKKILGKNGCTFKVYFISNEVNCINDAYYETLSTFDDIYIEYKAVRVPLKRHKKTIDEKINDIITNNYSVLNEMFLNEQDGSYDNNTHCLCLNLNYYQLYICNRENIGKKSVVYTTQSKNSYDVIAGKNFDE